MKKAWAAAAAAAAATDAPPSSAPAATAAAAGAGTGMSAVQRERPKLARPREDDFFDEDEDDEEDEDEDLDVGGADDAVRGSDDADAVSAPPAPTPAAPLASVPTPTRPPTPQIAQPTSAPKPPALAAARTPLPPALPTAAPPKRRATTTTCVCRGSADGGGLPVVDCHNCTRAYHAACVGIASVAAVQRLERFICPPCHEATGLTSSDKRRCAHRGCPTFDWAGIGSAYCSRTCGLAVARGRLLALQQAVPGASADPSDHTALRAELDAVNTALAHTAAQLDAVDLARREFAAALERYAAAPKPSAHDKTCTYPGCGQTAACEAHVDWQARTASGLWLQFDRTVYAAELLHQRKAMLEHELDRRHNGVARLLHPAIPADPPAAVTPNVRADPPPA